MQPQQPQQTAHIHIEDLPPIEQLTEEEALALFGAGRARLGIEALEKRDMMASNLMASLSGGVLRVEGTPNADRIRILQNADQIAVINDQSGSTLARFTTGAINRIEIAPLGGTDSIFAELGTLKAPLALTDGAAGDSFSDSISHVSQTLGNDVSKLLRRGDGMVLQLLQDGWVTINGNRTWRDIKDIALDKNQTLFSLGRNGVLEKLPQGGSWQTLGTNVQKFGINEYGEMVILFRSGELYVPGWYAWDGYKDMQIGSDGKVYALTQAGVLQKLADSRHWQNTEFSNVRKFGFDEYGRLTLLFNDGKLHVTGWYAWNGYKDMAFEATGKVYALTTDGQLRDLEDLAHWRILWTGVKQFGVDEYGRLVMLKASGELYVPGWYAWQGYKTLSFERNTGKVYALTNAGVVQSLADSAHWQILGPGLGVGTKLFFRNSESYLMALDASTNTIVNFNGASRVSDFAVLDGKVYIREMDPDSNGVRPLIRRALDGTLEGRYAYQQGGTKLFFRNSESLLIALDTVNYTAVKFNGDSKVSDFAVSGSKVYIRNTLGNLFWISTDGQRTGNLGYQKAGDGTLFLLDEGRILFRYNPLKGTIDKINGDRAVLYFAMRGSDVYIQETPGGVVFRRRLDGTGATRLEEVARTSRTLFFREGTSLMAWTVSNHSISLFRGAVKAFAVRGSNVYMLTSTNSLLRQNETSRTWTVLKYKPVSGKLIFTDQGILCALSGTSGLVRYEYKVTGFTINEKNGQWSPDGRLFFLATENSSRFLMCFDPSRSMVSKFNSTEVRAFAIRGNDVYMWEGGENSYLIKQGINSGSWSDPLSYNEVGGKLFFIDTDGCLRTLDTTTKTIADTVNGFTLSGDIAREWLTFGGPNSALGLPTSNQHTSATRGLFQDFQHGGISLVDGRVWFSGSSLTGIQTALSLSGGGEDVIYIDPQGKAWHIDANGHATEAPEHDIADEPQQVTGVFLWLDSLPQRWAFTDASESVAMDISDVVQGKDGCAFAATLASVAKSGKFDLPSGIRYGGQVREGVHAYAVRLYEADGSGGFREIWQRIEFDGKANVGEVTVGENGEFWGTLYHRAFITRFGWSNSIKASYEALTGHTRDYVDASNPDLERKLQEAIAAGVPIIADTLNSDDKRFIPGSGGLVYSHCYSVVGLSSLSCFGGSETYVTLRNPYGTDTGWRFYDADGSGQLDSQELEKFRQGMDGQNDGYIQVSWSSFVRYFDGISIGQV